MSTRDTLSRLALPLIGAAAVAAGAVLVQMTRKPESDVNRSDTLEPTPAQSAYHSGRATAVVRPPVPEIADADEASLLRRLRERGL